MKDLCILETSAVQLSYTEIAIWCFKTRVFLSEQTSSFIACNVLHVGGGG